MYDPNTLQDTIRSGYQLHAEAYWRAILEGREKHLEELCRPAIETLHESITQADKIEAIITAQIREMEGKDQAEKLCRNIPSGRSLVRKLLRAYFRGADSVNTPSAAVDDVSGPDTAVSGPDTVSAPEPNVPSPDGDTPATDANVPGTDTGIPGRGADAPAVDVNVPGPDTNVPAPAADAPTSGSGNSSADVNTTTRDGNAPAPDGNPVSASRDKDGVGGIDVNGQSNDNANGRGGRMGLRSPTRAQPRSKRDLEKGPEESQSAPKRSKRTPQYPKPSDSPARPPPAPLADMSGPGDMSDPQQKRMRTILSSEVEGTCFVTAFPFVGPGYYIVRDAQGRPCRTHPDLTETLGFLYRQEPRYRDIKDKAGELAARDEIIRTYGYRVLDSRGNDVSAVWAQSSNELLAQRLAEEKKRAKAQTSANQPVFGTPSLGGLDRARRGDAVLRAPTFPAPANPGLSPGTGMPLAPPGHVPRARHATSSQWQDGDRRGTMNLSQVIHPGPGHELQGNSSIIVLGG